MAAAELQVSHQQLASGRPVFRVDEVDNEVRLYWDHQLVMYVSRLSAVPQQCALTPGRLYTVRYNNNDGAGGGLRCSVLVVSDNGPRSELMPVNLTGLSGPTVLEFSFRVTPA